MLAPPPPPSPVDTPRLYSSNGARNYEAWRPREGKKVAAKGYSREVDIQLCPQLGCEIPEAQNRKGTWSRTLNYASIFHALL